ncbi:MAG TPA: succinate dehydrogenase, hydrophobic membrane anchor protein [Steroidobacteraceae bacterium]
MSAAPGPAPSGSARARGLGSARRGTGAWRAERVTAIALVPLTLWLVASLVALGRADRTAFVAWLGRPLHGFLTILLLIAVFRHTALGLQVIIEDYVHSAAKTPLLLLIHLLCFAICVAGVLATLGIMFAS